MVKIEEGGPSQDVPLIYYDKWGDRHVVGAASVRLVHGQLEAVGTYNNIPGATEVGEVELESFSVGPFRSDDERGDD